ncbi:ATP-dependent DNA helicase DDX11 [Hyalella azteca]|uniref:ATP-dependent DNA helicase DDX11 n=1 Tax=Hyalella azteca TaxID=294128 RepID=A0A8B7NAX0_HYAAZ|nr:ATP-dependent DNA helicase DDX11 [Hyalella azteca]
MSQKLPMPDDFSFPFPPYDIQLELMKKVFTALEDQKLAILESPTGTGKSLSLICSALTWLHKYNEVQQSRLEIELRAAEAAVQQCEAVDDWFAAAGVRQAQTEAVQNIKEKLSRLNKERSRIQAINIRKMKAKKEKESEGSFSSSWKTRDEKTSNNSRENISPQKKSPVGEDFLEEELDLLLNDDVDESSELEEAADEDEEEGCIKIYYCSRTHSQLSQFIGELQKTRFGGAQTRVVALASRHNLCINPDVMRLKHPNLVNDRCLDLQRGSSGCVSLSCADGNTKGQKRSKANQACPWNRPNAVRALGDELLTNVQDLEDAVKEGKALKACPYYAARTALRDAQLVLVPYNTVLQPGTREACGVRLKNNCLIVDEAHNLLGTLASVQELTLSLAQVCRSREQVQQYLQRYESRLSARNLLHLNQLLFCLKAFSSVLQPELNAKTAKNNATEAPDMVTTCAASDVGGAEEVMGGNPFLVCVELFRRLVTSHASARVLVNVDDSSRTIKYLVLDPASHFHDIVRQCRSVILVGGTMKPFQEFREQLFYAAGAPETRVMELSCGHVVPSENVLPVALSTGPTGVTLDLTHANRNQPHVVQEVGRVLYNACCVVPAGVVVFLPSYQYSELFLSLLRKQGLLDKIETKKKVFVEPRSASAVGALLAAYATAVRRSAEAAPGQCNGAVLFCVVGGKMSEGINFSDGLGRCVVMVGLPYPNTQSVELRERMKHLDAKHFEAMRLHGKKIQENSKAEEPSRAQRSGGEAYYHNLCFRAVNQSIGRAIRHRQDYACMLLLDQRYSRQSTVSALPDWISRSLLRADKYPSAHAAVAKFFAHHKQKQQR